MWKILCIIQLLYIVYNKKDISDKISDKMNPIIVAWLEKHVGESESKNAIVSKIRELIKQYQREELKKISAEIKRISYGSPLSTLGYTAYDAPNITYNTPSLGSIRSIDDLIIIKDE